MSAIASPRDLLPEERRSYIGASDIPVILGLSPFKSPFRLAQEKLALVAPEPENWFMRRGKYMEPIIRAEHADATGKQINARTITFEHAKYPFIRCHLDGHYVGDSRGSGLFEAKTAGYWMGLSEEWGEDGTLEFPLPYHGQNQGALAIINSSLSLRSRWGWGELVAWIDGVGKRAYPIVPDLRVQDVAIERCVKFWEALQSGNLDVLDRTTDDVKKLFPHSEEARIEAQGGIAEDARIVGELLDRKAAANAEIRAVEKELDPIQARVMHYMGTCDTLCIDGAPVLKWKEQSRDGYTVKPTTFRVFRRVTSKGN